MTIHLRFLDKLKRLDFIKILAMLPVIPGFMEVNKKMESYVLKGDFQSLIDYDKQGAACNLAIPTPEHYLPLIYTLALTDKKDSITFFNDQPIR